MEIKKVDIEIKDCPFCKGRSIAQQSSGCSGGGNKYTIVVCSRCEVGIQTTAGLRHTIGQWNNRPIEDELLWDNLKS